MRKFKLHWLGGEPKEEIVRGTDIADAFRRAGYGGGAIRALDYYEEIKDDKAETKELPKNHSKEEFEAWLSEEELKSRH